MSLNPPPPSLRTCRLFWCYQCHRAVRIISSTSDVFCPRCFGQFLHQIDLPRPRFLLSDFRRRDSDDATVIPYRSATWLIFDIPHAPYRPTTPAPPPSPPTAVNTGDYFAGPNMNELIDNLTQNDRLGLPPAPAAAIAAMPVVVISNDHLGGSRQCPVCKEEFGVGEEAREMPCNHLYHSDCIVPWLRIHNSCPVCRAPLTAAVAGGGDEVQRGGVGYSYWGGGSEDRQPTRWNPFSSLLRPTTRGLPPRGRWDYHYRSGQGEIDEGDTGNALGSFSILFVVAFLISIIALPLVDSISFVHIR